MTAEERVERWRRRADVYRVTAYRLRGRLRECREQLERMEARAVAAERELARRDAITELVPF